MEKNKLGWLINGVLVVGAIATSAIFPNPAVIFPVVAATTLIGTIQSMFTIVESKAERDRRERRTHVKQITTSENSPKPQKVYESLHSNENKATFKGNHTHLLDKRRSAITKPEVKKYISEITREKVNSATSTSTFDLARGGSEQMKSDGYIMANNETTLER